MTAQVETRMNRYSSHPIMMWKEARLIAPQLWSRLSEASREGATLAAPSSRFRGFVTSHTREIRQASKRSVTVTPNGQNLQGRVRRD